MMNEPKKQTLDETEDLEPEVDESLLTPEQKQELEKPFFKWKYLVVWGILLALIVACIVVISVLG